MHVVAAPFEHFLRVEERRVVVAVRMLLEEPIPREVLGDRVEEDGDGHVLVGLAVTHRCQPACRSSRRKTGRGRMRKYQLRT